MSHVFASPYPRRASILSRNPSSSLFSVTMEDVQEFQESTSIKFEWTLKGLKQLFESSRGKAKSKVTKSVKFGGGRWQVLFYANSGVTGTAASGANETSTIEGDEDGFISLYLSCEPTAEERANSVNGKWVREGVFKFGFELRNVHRTVLFNSKEAVDHSFSFKTVNWGWAQFARRDAVYWQPHSVKGPDAFVIVCTITSSPAPPVQPPSIPRLPVPRDLLFSVGTMLDDPAYSDIEFILPRRGRGSLQGAKTIKAAKKLLQRVEYFDTMFNSGFAEATESVMLFGAREADDGYATAASPPFRTYADSDDEDDDNMLETDDDQSMVDFSDGETTHSRIPTAPSVLSTNFTEDESDACIVETDTTEPRNVRQKVTHPSSPRRTTGTATLSTGPPADKFPPRPMTRVVVRDASYSAYRSVLYYIYTDNIIFAPLSSSFINHSTSDQSMLANAAGPSESSSNVRASQSVDSAVISGVKSRREWIKVWEGCHPGQPSPCSAKAVYRLADRLDLSDLKHRAFQFIIKSLTVENVPFEVFSTFSVAYEEVRKVQIKYFLDNWGAIRASDTMKNVWQQIRLGRHPGYEEVWPLIAQNLEFKPQPEATPGGESRDV
ncbi:hypothetical protein BJ322DRAFT_1092448 [Thelephora terrestris]|uniref:MATH domain-containing protein n=1 Tax=Thelephora terrestris TaxID=56493 RepID=A0A9P6L230_9AGAM|nr:hypothetical protein BJ322DRAFT_1092448 [Thelephora terrestris]